MWNVVLQCDILKCGYNEALHAHVFCENWHIIAYRGRESYLHLWQFWDDYSLAKTTQDCIIEQVKEPVAFAPWLWPEQWAPIRDRKPFRARELQYTKLRKKWWIEQTPYKRS